MDRILRWFAMPIGKQLYNIGSEVERAIRWKDKNDLLKTANFTIKAIELIGLTKMDPKNVKRFHELNFYEQELLDYLIGENIYQNDGETIMKLYDQWAHCV